MSYKQKERESYIHAPIGTNADLISGTGMYGKNVDKTNVNETNVNETNVNEKIQNTLSPKAIKKFQFESDIYLLKERKKQLKNHGKILREKNKNLNELRANSAGISVKNLPGPRKNRLTHTRNKNNRGESTTALYHNNGDYEWGNSKQSYKLKFMEWVNKNYKLEELKDAYDLNTFINKNFETKQVRDLLMKFKEEK